MINRSTGFKMEMGKGYSFMNPGETTSVVNEHIDKGMIKTFDQMVGAFQLIERH